MTLGRAVMLFAGSMVILSAILAWQVSPWWLLLTGFVGLNLIQTSFTRFCPAAMVLRALGLKEGTSEYR